MPEGSSIRVRSPKLKKKKLKIVGSSSARYGNDDFNCEVATNLNDGRAKGSLRILSVRLVIGRRSRWLVLVAFSVSEGLTAV